MFTKLRARYLASAATALGGSVAMSSGLGLRLSLIAAEEIGSYGAARFFFAPALIGFSGAVLFTRWNGSITIPQALGVTLLALLFGGEHHDVESAAAACLRRALNPASEV